MSDTLHTDPKRDNFSHESPIRAFTDFQVHGQYAIGKGFRPSLHHTATYLDAMESKEGWRVVQVLEAAGGSPSFLFRRMEAEPTVSVTVPNPDLAARYRDAYPEVAAAWIDDKEVTSRVIGKHPALGMSYTPSEDEVLIYDESGMVTGATTPLRHLKPSEPLSDDPINPKHYNGRECADIGERLSANGYQILKYCWRLGKKDDPCQELGKALWYLDSELKLIKIVRARTVMPCYSGIKPDKVVAFLEQRIGGQPDFTQTVARLLWAGYDTAILRGLEARILQEKTYLECGRGLAV